VKVTLIFLLLLSQSLCLAATDNDQQLRKVQSKIKAVSGNLSRLKKQQGDASSELKHIEKQYGKISQNLARLNKQVTQKQQRINEIHKEIKIQQRWLDTQKSHLSGQIKAAYALGHQEQLKLLFNLNDSSRSSRVMTYYQYFNKARLNKLQHINASLQLLSTLEVEKQLEKQKIAELAQQKNTEKQKLKKSTSQRKSLLKKIKKDYKSKSSQLTKLKKNERQLLGLITALQQAKTPQLPSSFSSLPFSKLKGKLPWPVSGKIIKSFSRQSDGVLISAKEGRNVRAVAHGQIVFSNWFKGYGLLVIIKHDKNYMSLYAFNQSLYKEKGTWVEAGEIISTAGKSGGRDKTGLYFEIRKKNKPLNPKKWCKKR